MALRISSFKLDGEAGRTSTGWNVATILQVSESKPGTRVVFSVRGAGEYGSVPTDSTGTVRFVFHNLPPGEQTLIAQVKDGGYTRDCKVSLVDPPKPELPKEKEVPVGPQAWERGVLREEDGTTVFQALLKDAKGNPVVGHLIRVLDRYRVGPEPLMSDAEGHIRYEARPGEYLRQVVVSVPGTALEYRFHVQKQRNGVSE